MAPEPPGTSGALPAPDHEILTAVHAAHRLATGCPPPELVCGWVDGLLWQLAPAGALALTSHLTTCPHCRLDVQRWRTTLSRRERALAGWRRIPLRWRLMLAVCLGVAAAFLVRPSAPPESLDWHYNAATRHWYARTPEVPDWAAAETLARAQGGHLVIVTSEAVNRWLAKTLLNVHTYGAYIGLREVGSEGHWVWVDGRPLSATGYSGFLGPVEPSNDSGGPHDVAAMWGLWDKPHGAWNDTRATPLQPGRPGYDASSLVRYGLVERESPPGSQTMAKSGKVLVLLLGLLLGNVAAVVLARWTLARRFRRAAAAHIAGER